MKDIKVIFLDFDGVLNNMNDPQSMMDLRGRNMSVFNDLMDQLPDVKIVISSSWRICRTVSQLTDTLVNGGFKHPLSVIGMTPISRNSNDLRGDEISGWLTEQKKGKKFNIIDFVILDDNEDMTIHMDKLILTDINVGLTVNDVNKVINLLK